MKTIILTSLFASILFFGNATILSANDDKDLYSNVETDPATNTTTTTYYREGKLMNAVYEKKIVIKHDDNNNPVEKYIYKWSQVSNKWIPVQKQQFLYNALNQMASASLTKWDEKRKDWEKDIKFVEYTYSDNGEILSVVSK